MQPWNGHRRPETAPGEAAARVAAAFYRVLAAEAGVDELDSLRALRCRSSSRQATMPVSSTSGQRVGLRGGERARPHGGVG